MSDSPSPIDDILNQPMENGNQELAGIVRNLRHTEHHLQSMYLLLFLKLTLKILIFWNKTW